MGFGGPAAGEVAKAQGVGQVRHICPSGGNATPKGQKRHGDFVPVVGMEDDMLKPTLAVAFSDPRVLLRCLLLCYPGNLLCIAVTGEQGNWVGVEGECQSRMWVFIPLCLPCCFLEGWCLFPSSGQEAWALARALSLCSSSCRQSLWLLCLCTVKTHVQGHSWFH